MKDFYDPWLLANQFSFDGPLLAKAITATFAWFPLSPLRPWAISDSAIRMAIRSAAKRD